MYLDRSYLSWPKLGLFFVSLNIILELYGYTFANASLDCSGIHRKHSNCSTESSHLVRAAEGTRVQRDVDVVCSNGDATNNQSQAMNCGSLDGKYGKTKEKAAIEVYIRTPNNTNRHELGSSLTIQCRFNTSLNQDLRFNLRWLRSVEGSSGNQSITATDTDDSSSTLIAATTRVWTVQRNGGLDLELNNFQTSDVGDYFCQALSLQSDSILSEAHVQLMASSTEDPSSADLINGIYSQYSQHTLANLLPSLKVAPEFSELQLGANLQLICYTEEPQDPDPKASELEWSFEMLHRWPLTRKPQPVPLGQLSNHVNVMGNALMIWSMTEENAGLYKCTRRMAEFNLSVEAVATVLVQSAGDAAPHVLVRPEVIRLSPNGSATIQCEATGYPGPDLIWYRVEGMADPNLHTTERIDAATGKYVSSGFVMEGVEVERIQYKDVAAYCQFSNLSCITSEPGPKMQYWSETTGVSLLHLRQARAEHQGQYVCRASNKHGSNQASSLVDVEFKEPPVVRIAQESREQTILLRENTDSGQMNVTFKCSLESGRPQPRLRWLRTSNKHNLKADNLDIYDLTKVSSATSNISTWVEDDGRSLILMISTISLDDEGDYVCLGENEWGRNSAIAHLSVHRPGSVRILQTSPLLAHPNTSFHLDCMASGHPVPLDIEWSRSDRGAFFSLISRTSSAIEGSQDRAILKFDRVSPEESGEYTCNARSALNHSEILRDTIMVLVDQDGSPSGPSGAASKVHDSQRPRLMVRPTTANVLLGSNVTIDCLAVSGLQPTVVEWIAPPAANDPASHRNLQPFTFIRPYYWADNVEVGMNQVYQFGSKLKIFNVTKGHEGVYQCNGRNKIDVESAPALIKVVDSDVVEDVHIKPVNGSSTSQSKTKIALVGSNIELKCQMNGVEEPVTSWSRDGMELPVSSVQIGHNLWIQNVSSRDNGLYICSVRSTQPNRVIQAKINLLVRGSAENPAKLVHNLSAKIVASKSNVNIGDSLTLECMINQQNSTASSTTNSQISEGSRLRSADLEELESNVVWTNLHSGQTLFQDNVYIQNNLLIIYELRLENSATYRCNYNDLSQYTDYRLQVTESTTSTQPPVEDTPPSGRGPIGQVNISHVTAANGQRVELRQVSLGSQVTVVCPIEHQASATNYYWTRGNRQLVLKRGEPLVFESIRSEDADIYNCHNSGSKEPRSVIVHVLVPTARFLQKPVSFISLPSISGADHQLDIEVKFLPERENGLILFNGQNQVNNRSLPMGGDYISLGLSRGYLEFRFELGDGTTLLRSFQTLSLHVWHKVVIERNRRGAVMWLNRQPPVSNSSSGKFYNLNLDSLLYVGGNIYLRNKTRFHGYSRGFQGCISLLRIGHQDIDLMAHNRSVKENIYECDKPECKANLCNQQNGICQVDRSFRMQNDKKADPTRRTSTGSDTRCICMPGFTGSHCEKNFQDEQALTTGQSNISQTSTTVVSISPPVTEPAEIEGSCQTLKPCSANGTIECQSLTSTSYKCHCAMGFVGDTCAQVVSFSSETAVWFNQQSYLRFKLNKPEEALAYLRAQPLASDIGNTTVENFNATNFAKLTSMVENQEIAFKLRTKASYGLIFYTGQATILDQANATLTGGLGQTSKSMVANLLARLSNIIFDYLAIALVDGHIELSYELGSGVSIIRSSNRVNDGEQHNISVLRNGKFARLTIDETHKHEGSSPGKLSMLNSQPDIYLGGLPHLAELTNNMYMSGFEGCISEIHINTLGPLNLIGSSYMSQIESSRNLAPCSGFSSLTPSTITSTARPKPKPYQAPPSSSDSDESEET